MKDILSKKQRQVLALLREKKLARINILQGSVRSGKTYVSLILWGFWIATMPSDSVFLMAGKTLSTLKRNAFSILEEVFGENFSYSIAKKEALLFGRKIYLEGVSDSRAEGKIRGMTLDGAYCDELTLFEEDFFAMLLSRLSKKGAKLIATTNPDHPRHWLKVNYLDNRELDLISIKFTLEDNIFLEKSYIESLKNEYKGMFYQRFIKGEWVAAEGRIYEEFSKENIISTEGICERLNKNPLILCTMGVDYGGSGSASAFCITGFDRGFKNLYVLEEFYDKKNKSAENLIDSFKLFVGQMKNSYPMLNFVYCDSAEQLLLKSFRNSVSIEVKNALKKSINTRINILNRLIAARRFFIAGHCRNTINAINDAVWDSKNLHKDVRLDDGTSNIDSLDAMEYGFERYERELFKF